MSFCVPSERVRLDGQTSFHPGDLVRGP